MKACKQCGKENSDNAKFCGICGYKFEEQPVINKKSKANKAIIIIIAFVLIVCIFFSTIVFIYALASMNNKAAIIKEITTTPAPTCETCKKCYPTLPPVVYVVTATPLPEQKINPTAVPAEFKEIQHFKGSGKFTTEMFDIQDGIIRVKWKYVGDSNFAFYLRRFDNDARELLENEIGSVTGQKMMKVGYSDQYVIDVDYGSGKWDIVIEWMPQ